MCRTRSIEKSWPLSRAVTSSCAVTHLGICPSTGQKNPFEKVLPGVSALLMELASHVHRRTKEICSGLVSGCGRDHERDTDVRMPPSAESKSALRARQMIDSSGR